MKLSQTLVVLLVTLGLGACAAPDRGWMGSPLKDTSWQLVTIEANNNDFGREYVANKANVVMNLKANGDAEFVLGCETGATDWMASWERVDVQGSIQFDQMQINATPTPCEPNLVVQRFLRDFDFMRSYVLIQNHLYLNTEANETTYGWRKIESN